MLFLLNKYLPLTGLLTLLQWNVWKISEIFHEIFQGKKKSWNFTSLATNRHLRTIIGRKSHSCGEYRLFISNFLLVGILNACIHTFVENLQKNTHTCMTKWIKSLNLLFTSVRSWNKSRLSFTGIWLSLTAKMWQVNAIGVYGNRNDQVLMGPMGIPWEWKSEYWIAGIWEWGYRYGNGNITTGMGMSFPS